MFYHTSLGSAAGDERWAHTRGWARAATVCHNAPLEPAAVMIRPTRTTRSGFTRSGFGYVTYAHMPFE